MSGSVLTFSHPPDSGRHRTFRLRDQPISIHQIVRVWLSRLAAMPASAEPAPNPKLRYTQRTYIRRRTPGASYANGRVPQRGLAKLRLKPTRGSRWVVIP